MIRSTARASQVVYAQLVHVLCTRGVSRVFALLALLLAAACADETLSGYADRRAEYVLKSIDGTTFPATATISFPGPGKVAGRGPCNRYSGALTVPYPWFETGALAATRMACPALEQEAAFFADLSAMTLAEVAGKVLILSNDDGRQMLFEAR